MGGGGTTVKVPDPTPEERALQRNQAELLALQRSIIEQNRAQQAILIPFFAEQEGFDVEVDENGNITSITRIPTELDLKREELEEAEVDRALAAIRGELPVSPALERDLAQQERTLREQLSQQFGPGFETSTPGIQTLGDFFEVAEGLREGARTQQLTLAEQLSLAREQQQDFSRMSSQDFLRQVGLGDPLTMAGSFGQVASGFGQAQAPFIKQREMQTNAAIASAQANASMWGAGIGAIGSIVGGLFSDERLKHDAEVIGTLEPFGIPIYEYTYGGERRIGVFAGDVEELVPGAVSESFGYKTVSYEDITW